MVDDMGDLSLQAYRLYGHIKRVAGDSGEFFEGSRTTAKACNMAHGSVTPAKRELIEKRLIVVGIPGDPKACRPDLIRVVNVWSENFTRYRTRSEYEQVNGMRSRT